MNSIGASATTEKESSATSLPSWLSKHFQINYSADDISALIESIDASQLSDTSSPSQLPAEILLLVLEFVPIDYILDWRLVCRGFRDAIDGRVLYHHLQRTELLGLMDTSTISGGLVSPEQEDRLRFVNSHYEKVTNGSQSEKQAPARSIWDHDVAVYRIGDPWFEAFREIIGVDPSDYTSLQGMGERWLEHVDRLRLAIPDSGFGNLRWCVKLDHAVLDLALPLTEKGGAMSFNISVRLSERTVTVKWRDMLHCFLKTEAMLRRKLETSIDGRFTHSPVEDCLREVRRERLNASLDLDTKSDRHIKWSLRLLRPLFGKPQPSHSSALQDVEDRAMNTLLLLRREAGMTPGQKAYLRQLNEDRQTMAREIEELSDNFDMFKSHLQPQTHFSISNPFQTSANVPRDPIAWPDDLRAVIEERVSKWKSQRKVIRQMSALLVSSNETLAVPEGSFDDLSSEI